MNIDKERTNKYAKNELEEKVLYEMNQALYPKELEFIKDYDIPQKPVIFIVGAQRSGTTLLMQLMINFFELAYPNNFIARYWNVPYIGAVLYKSLSKKYGLKQQVDLSSDLGYTQGLEGPHEFGYFWRKWFPWESWEKKNYDKINYQILLKELDAWQRLENKPLAFKNIIQVSFNIKKINEIIPNSFFVYIKRQPEYVVQSTLLSRIKLYGSQNKWMGLKPPEYNEIIKLPIIEQIVAQVYYSQLHIEADLKATNHIYINYEELTSNPTRILHRISKEIKIPTKQQTIPQLKDTNQIKIDKNDFDKLTEICNKYFKN